MPIPVPNWLSKLRLHQKVWLILLLVLVPLVAALAVQALLIDHLLTVQHHGEQTASIRYEMSNLRRLTIIIEDAIRGYLLTGNETFLAPLAEAEGRLPLSIERARGFARDIPGFSEEVNDLTRRLQDLLEAKKNLIRAVQGGHPELGLEYVRSGKGLALSYGLRAEIVRIEERFAERARAIEADAYRLTQFAFKGVLAALVGAFALGLLGVRLLTRSITGPMTALQVAAKQLGTRAEDASHEIQRIPDSSPDEIGELARSFEEMARQVNRHIRELEVLSTIGNEINMLGPDGVQGVLHRITDRAAKLLQGDACLVLLRDEKMGCWIVEAASDPWQERLYKSVMLWEELPIPVRAFETKMPVSDDGQSRDVGPEGLSRSLLAERILALPLIDRGVSFGVLALLSDRKAVGATWNVPLAEGFAAAAAIAISNARLYEAAHLKEQGLESRLRRLEHLAESLAHDLSGPGARIEGLSGMLAREYRGRLDDRGMRWLQLLEQHGRELTERVRGILEVACVGSQREAVEAVDPGGALQEVLISRSGELDERGAKVSVIGEFPKVACHRAYLRQIFDNLISNAVKFSGDRSDFEIRIRAERESDRLCLCVEDNGIGIPSMQRDRVFDPFVRLNPTRTKGNGIGLAIVKRIVDLYGGKVWIDSNDRGGCTVRFTLPLLGELRRVLPGK